MEKDMHAFKMYIGPTKCYGMLTVLVYTVSRHSTHSCDRFKIALFCSNRETKPSSTVSLEIKGNAEHIFTLSDQHQASSPSLPMCHPC